MNMYQKALAIMGLIGLTVVIGIYYIDTTTNYFKIFEEKDDGPNTTYWQSNISFHATLDKESQFAEQHVQAKAYALNFDITDELGNPQWVYYGDILKYQILEKIIIKVTNLHEGDRLIERGSLGIIAIGITTDKYFEIDYLDIDCLCHVERLDLDGDGIQEKVVMLDLYEFNNVPTEILYDLETFEQFENIFGDLEDQISVTIVVKETGIESKSFDWINETNSTTEFKKRCLESDFKYVTNIEHHYLSCFSHDRTIYFENYVSMLDDPNWTVFNSTDTLSLGIQNRCEQLLVSASQSFCLGIHADYDKASNELDKINILELIAFLEKNPHLLTIEERDILLSYVIGNSLDLSDPEVDKQAISIFLKLVEGLK